MLKRATSGGVTLIELMIGLAIVAMLLGLGLPSLSAWLANARVRTAAEGLQAGLAMARSEAMRRNQNVEFVVTNDTIDIGSVATLAADVNGMHWAVRFMDPTIASYSLIDARSGFEGTGRADGQPAAVQVTASDPLIVFRGMGGTNLGALATFDVSNPGAGACHTTATPSPIRCLRVQVSVSGLVRLCDPSVTDAADTRGC
jgi:type IV fimbrial biogenesis protein FimT